MNKLFVYFATERRKEVLVLGKFGFFIFGNLVFFMRSFSYKSFVLVWHYNFLRKRVPNNENLLWENVVPTVDVKNGLKGKI